MEGESIERRLYAAAEEGKIEILREIHRQDSQLVYGLTVGRPHETLLHVALLHGQVDFANELLNLYPGLAESFNSRRSTPLHLAAAKGYLQIVEKLVSIKANMCTALDGDGLNPLHLAAMNGRVDVLRVLVETSPKAALAKVGHGGGHETILHLCVNYNQTEALTVLLVEANNDQIKGLVNATDEYGNTLLHLAVAQKQTKMVEYLLESGSVYAVNAINANGNTALDILTQSRREVQDFDIGEYLRGAGALKATNIGRNRSTSNPEMPSKVADITHNGYTNNPEMPSFLRNQGHNSPNLDQGLWLVKKRDALMVVASLLATMAFQAGVSPPGGVWQDDSLVLQNVSIPHRAGEAVIAYTYPDSYKYYLRANTISFVASVSTILLLISGLPIKRKLYMYILMVILWVSITSMAFTYSYATVAVTPKKDRGALRRTMYVAVPVWCGVMAILLFGHTIRLLQNKWRNMRQSAQTVGQSSNSVVAKHANGNQEVSIEMRNR